jgi:hypothetical protein
VRDLKGFPDRTIRLPADAGEEILGEFCRDHTARLLAWIAAPDGQAGVTYDGTIRSLSRLYQQHADSPFHDVKRNTRKTYADKPQGDREHGRKSASPRSDHHRRQAVV